KGTPREFLQMVSPVVVFIAGLWWFYVALRFRWTLMPKDYVALAMLVLGIFYFQKFVWRADRYHLYQAFVVSAPIVAYMTEKICRGRTRSGAVFALALLAAGPTLARITDSSPHRIVKHMPAADYQPQFGYVQGSSGLARTLSALEPVVASVPGPIFDFTNEPALFHFLLGAPPSTPFFHVSMAISRESQALVLDKLAESPPGLVVYASDGIMWAWDSIPNPVRHADISEYLLRNWHPFAVIASHVLLRRDGSSGSLALDPKVAYRDVPSCNWGYVPHFDGPPGVQFRELAALTPQSRAVAGTVVTIVPDVRERALPVETLRRTSYVEFAFDDLKADGFALFDGDEPGAEKEAPIRFRSR